MGGYLRGSFLDGAALFSDLIAGNVELSQNAKLEVGPILLGFWQVSLPVIAFMFLGSLLDTLCGPNCSLNFTPSAIFISSLSQLC